MNVQILPFWRQDYISRAGKLLVPSLNYQEGQFAYEGETTNAMGQRDIL